MKCMVFGGTGYIGSRLCPELLRCGNDVICYHKNKSLSLEISNSFDEHYSEIIGDFSVDNLDEQLANVDCVFHLIYARVDLNQPNSLHDEIVLNVLPTVTLLDACVKNNVKKFVFVSSGGTVYGDIGKKKACESFALYPLSTYATQKAMIENIIYMYCKKHAINCDIIRLSNPYGNCLDSVKHRCVIDRFLLNSVTSHPSVLYGDGSAVRDFIYIDDAINGIITIASDLHSSHLINLGSGRGTSIADVISVIEDCTGRPFIYKKSDNRPDDLKYNVLDVSLYKSLYGSPENFCLKCGIERTYQELLNTIAKQN